MFRGVPGGMCRSSTGPASEHPGFLSTAQNWAQDEHSLRGLSASVSWPRDASDAQMQNKPHIELELEPELEPELELELEAVAHGAPMMSV